MVNLSSFLNSQSQILSKKSNYVKTNILDLTKAANRGTATVRIISDKSGVPLQTIKGVFQVYETLPRYDEKGAPVLNEDGTQATRYSTIEIPYASNYDLSGLVGAIKPTDSQLAKLNRLTDMLSRYSEFVNEEWISQEETETRLGVRYRSCITSFWAKVFSVVPTGGSNIIEEPSVYLCKHVSGKFVSTFKEICDQQRQARGEENAAIYLDKFVSNEPGKYDSTTTISTLLGSNGTVGYSVALSLMDGLKPYELTQEDIDQCEDLSIVGWDFKNFDDKKVDRLISTLEKVLAECDKRVAEYNGASVVDSSEVGTPMTSNPVVTSEAIGTSTSQVVNDTSGVSTNVTPVSSNPFSQF